MMDLRTFADVKAKLTNGSSLVDIVQVYLGKIQENQDLNAFLEVFETSALEQAKRIDQK